MRPTGKLHLGHYLGVIDNWVKLQDEYDCYFSVADWHALTTKYDKTETLKQIFRTGKMAVHDRTQEKRKKYSSDLKR